MLPGQAITAVKSAPMRATGLPSGQNRAARLAKRSKPRRATGQGIMEL